jgi:hypothetical protein
MHDLLKFLPIILLGELKATSARGNLRCVCGPSDGDAMLHSHQYKVVANKVPFFAPPKLNVDATVSSPLVE